MRFSSEIGIRDMRIEISKNHVRKIAKNASNPGFRLSRKCSDEYQPSIFESISDIG